MSLHPENRKLLVVHRFKTLENQALNPLKFDNEKCWIKFYHKYNTSKKKFRYAVTSKSISMNEMYRSTVIGGLGKNNESTATISTSHTMRTIVPNFNRSTVKL